MKTIAMHHRIPLLVGACATLLMASNASAGPIAYTDRGLFDTAVGLINKPSDPIIEKTLNFESPATPGTIFPSGSTFQGVTFDYTISGGYQLAVSNQNPGTSGDNTLKLSKDGGANFATFQLGDSITFTFGASHAFGMYIIVGSKTFDFFAEDVNLTFGGITLSNTGDAEASEVGTSSKVAALFVGIVDDAATFTQATLRFGPPNASPAADFEIDDIVLTAPPEASVPEPATLALLGLGLLGLRLRRRPAVVAG